MGDPRRLRKKYSGPAHPWQRERIDAERTLKKEYAFKNHAELWKMNSVLHNFKNRAKKLIAATGRQAEQERAQLMQRLARLGLTQSDAKLDTILGLSINDVMERRLQSLLYRRGLSRSMKQARQFITHYHVKVNGRKVSSPSYLVPKDKEDTISFADNSTLRNPEHPERTPVNSTKKAEKVMQPEKDVQQVPASGVAQ